MVRFRLNGKPSELIGAPGDRLSMSTACEAMGVTTRRARLVVHHRDPRRTEFIEAERDIDGKYGIGQSVPITEAAIVWCVPIPDP